MGMTISFLVTKTHLQSIEVSSEDAEAKSLMSLLLDAHLPVASSCKGDGICSKCRVDVRMGKENLSPELDLEAKTKKRNRVPEHNRLACQVYVRGSVTIDTDYW